MTKRQALIERYGEDYVNLLERYRKDAELTLAGIAQKYGISRQAVHQHFRALFPRAAVDRIRKIRARMQKKSDGEPAILKHYPELKRLPLTIKPVPGKTYLFKDQRGRLYLVRRTTRQRQHGKEYCRVRFDRLHHLLDEVDYVLVLDGERAYRVPAHLFPKANMPLFDPEYFRKYAMDNL